MLLFIIVLMASSLMSMDKTRQQLDKVIDDHATKVALSMGMRSAAHNRTLILFQLIHISDPFELDEAWMLFNQKATDFTVARNQLLNMPLSEIERGLLNEQGKLTTKAIPIQQQIVELISAGKILMPVIF